MEFMPGRICALALMPGRICALELMPGRIQSKNETIHIYKYNIPFIDKYLLEKNQQSCTMKLKYIREANRPVILNYYNFEIFQYFLSSKSTFMTCPQTGRIQF